MYQDSSRAWLRFMSLGFYGCSTGCWLLSSVEVTSSDGNTNTILKLSGWQADEKEDSAPTPLFHMAMPCMTGGKGLGWLCHTNQEDVILFALQKGAPLSTAQLVLLANFIDQVDQAPCDLPPSTLADPSLLDILLLSQMKARLPGGLPSDAQSVLTAAHRHVVREANWTHYRYKASWGEHNACA